MISGKKITLLVGGSIAAYKSAELVREFLKRGAEVQVAMSQSAAEFISPLTLQTLSGNPVATDLFDACQESEIGHIQLADRADIVVVAPATADLIAKAAYGMADSLLSTIILATRAPVLFAPAMNVNMWENDKTQDNVERLRANGAYFVEPTCGELACGWFGAGRLAEIESIVEEVSVVLTPKDLLGSHVIVTAGTTREHIDPIRFLSNGSSGKMGYALARVARRRGARVSLISGPTALPPPDGVRMHPVTTALEMREKIFELVHLDNRISPDERPPTQFVFMAAAVADFRPKDFSEQKRHDDKTQDLSIPCTPNPDILRELGESRDEIEADSGTEVRLIGFSLETGDHETLLYWAREKLQKKKIDLIIANFAEDAFGRDTNRVWLLDRNGREEEIATADKHLVAGKIISAALRI